MLIFVEFYLSVNLQYWQPGSIWTDVDFRRGVESPRHYGNEYTYAADLITLILLVRGTRRLASSNSDLFIRCRREAKRSYSAPS